jgi:beta-xylosidase
LYYHFFSEVKPEGRVTMMRRSSTLTGLAEVRQLNHVKLYPAVGEIADREPNQGGIVQVPDGSWWFVTHQGNGNWEGRTLCVLPVTWRDGWPIIGAEGVDGIGNMVWEARLPVRGQRRSAPQSSDDFRSSQLGPQWEWNYQPRAGKWSLTERRGWLRLRAFAPLERGNLFKAGNTITQRILVVTA